MWASGRAPRPGVIGHLRGFSSLASESVPRMSDRWTMHLRFDPSVPAPGPGWLINDAAHAGEGHELDWQPSLRALRFYRAQDRFLLGSVRLPAMPQTVDLVRSGAWYRISADGAELLACLDPLAQGPEAAPGWGIEVDGGTLGDAELTLLDDRIPGHLPGTTAPEAGADADQARAEDALRELLGLRAPASVQVVEGDVGNATAALALLPESSESHRRLHHWLALALARVSLAQDDASPERAREAVAQLALLARLDPVPESAGMLISLLPDLAERVRWRPTTAYSASAESVLSRHARWLEVLGEDALAAIESTPQAAGLQLHYELRLVAHATGCLRSSPSRGAPPDAPAVEPSPVPEEAPPFVVARWRAFAGSDPGPGPLPDPPAGLIRDPVTRAIDALVADAVLDPPAAVSLCCQVRSLLAQVDVVKALASPLDIGSVSVLARSAAQARAAGEHAPRREAALTQALLALHGVGTREAACQALVASYGPESPLAQHDALAYALLSLLVQRDPSLIDAVPASLRARDRIGVVWSQEAGASQLRPQSRMVPRQLLRGPAELKELANFAPLLSGDEEASAQAWRMQSAELPPAQALAAALAAQEAMRAGAGPSPQWRLLAEISSYTLPLELEVPQEQAAGGALAHDTLLP